MEPDSVPIDQASPAALVPPPAPPSPYDWKILLSLLASFMVIVSGAFVNGVVGSFGEKAVRGRSPTSYGVVIQGICLVMCYVLATYLIQHGVI